jgi:hypothetical protein
MRRSLVWLAALALTTGGAAMAQADDCHALKQLTWLLGIWRCETEARQVHERWAAVSTETWEGYGETRARGRADAPGALLESETLRLVEMAGEVYYIAKVAHHPLPVAFRLTQCGPGFAIFENRAHDFPRVIAYRLEKGTLIAEVGDGEAGGRSFTLRFTPD